MRSSLTRSLCSCFATLTFVSYLALADTSKVTADESTPASIPASAEPVPAAGEPEFDHFHIRAGAFLLSSIKTTLRLDADGEQVGDDLDFSRDLGGDSSLNVFRAGGVWRFARNHRINLDYFDINQETRHVLERDIVWGGETFPLRAEVDTQFRTTTCRLGYGFTFYRHKDNEFIALIGAHVTRIEVGISAPNLGRSESIAVTAPLPVLGLKWKARLSERLSSDISYEYFGISLDDKYSGNLSDFAVLLDYSLSEHWMIGGGYNRFGLRASVESERLKLSMKHSYNGLIIYLGAHF
jgi:hypothetical protein